MPVRIRRHLLASPQQQKEEDSRQHCSRQLAPLLEEELDHQNSLHDHLFGRASPLGPEHPQGTAGAAVRCRQRRPWKCSWCACRLLHWERLLLRQLCVILRLQEASWWQFAAQGPQCSQAFLAGCGARLQQKTKTPVPPATDWEESHWKSSSKKASWHSALTAAARDVPPVLESTHAIPRYTLGFCLTLCFALPGSQTGPFQKMPFCALPLPGPCVVLVLQPKEERREAVAARRSLVRRREPRRVLWMLKALSRELRILALLVDQLSASFIGESHMLIISESYSRVCVLVCVCVCARARLSSARVTC